MKLYEISAAINGTLSEAVNEDTGEINPALASVLNGLEMQFSDKVAGIVGYIKNTKAEAEAFEAEAARLAARAASLNKRADWLKEYIKCEMTRLGMTKSGTELHAARIQPNSVASMRAKGDVPLEVDVIAEALAELKRTSPTSFGMTFGPWRLTVELSATELKKLEDAPENAHVEFVKGTHVRVK